jgi:hypothetical protein
MLLKLIGMIFINPLVYLLAGLVFLFITKKSRKVFIFFLALYFYLFSIGFTSHWFSSQWGVADTYKPKENYEAAVVLAGVLNVSWYLNNGSLFYVPENYIHSAGTFERILAGLHFLKTGQAGQLLFGEWIYDSFNEGQRVKRYLTSQGINENRRREGLSGKETSEEKNPSDNLAAAYEEIDCHVQENRSGTGYIFDEQTAARQAFVDPFRPLMAGCRGYVGLYLRVGGVRFLLRQG